MNPLIARTSRLKGPLSSVHWRWVLPAGVSAPIIATVLWAGMVLLYVAILAALARGAPDAERIQQFGSQGAWAGRLLALGLTVVAASWVARKTGTQAVLHGVLVGLVSGISAPIVWMGFHSIPAPWELATVALSAGAGWLGGLEARSTVARQEALYRSSRAIAAAQSPEAVVEAIGQHLADPQVSRVGLWQVVSQAEDNSPAEIVLLASWTSDTVKPWPSGLRLRTDRMPVLARLRGEAPTPIKVDSLPVSERTVWEQLEVGSTVLLPLGGRDGAWIGLIMVASQTSSDFSRGMMGKYLAISAQAALVLENLRLVEQGRQIGVLAERQRLAHEIHDTLAQGFTSIVMHLEAAEQALPTSSETALGHIDWARGTARESLAEARRVVWALRPEILEGASLPEAIERLTRRWSQESGVRSNTDVTGAPRPLSTSAEATLLRAAQEALANVRKHAGAGNVAVTLSYMEDLVALDVRDDGAGFDPAQALRSIGSAAGGFGLAAMRQRVERQGGQMIIESAPGEGTTLVVELPVPPGARVPPGPATGQEVL